MTDEGSFGPRVIQRREKTKFLNVDLDIKIRSGLDDLIEAFGTSIVTLRRTNESAAIELGRDYASIDETVTAWSQLIASLSPNAREIWERCQSRSANIGIQAGHEPHAACFNISNKALLQLVSIGAEVVLTVYSPVA